MGTKLPKNLQQEVSKVRSRDYKVNNIERMKCNLFPWGSDLYRQQQERNSISIRDRLWQSAHLKIEKLCLQFEKPMDDNSPGAEAVGSPF